MKTKYLGMLAVMAMLSLSACSNKEDLPQEPAAEAMPICFKVSTEDMQSRASHTNSNTLDEFGVKIQSRNPYNLYPKNKFIFASHGEGEQRIWTAKNTNLGWYPAPHEVSFFVCYPHTLFDSEDMVFSVESDQTADSYLSDIMIGSSSRYIKSPTSESVNTPIIIKFEHMLSQLQVVLTLPEGYTADKINSITISGTKTSGIIRSGYYGYFADVTGNKIPVSAYKIPSADAAGNTVTFKCILIPQEVTLSVSFIYENNYYKWVSPQPINLVANNIHTLNLKVNNAAATQTQSMQSRSWGPTTGRCQIDNSMN